MSSLLNIKELHFCTHFSEADQMLIARAYATAVEALKDRTRENGDPFIFHALAVARMAVEEMGLMPLLVVAILLHEAFPLHKEEKAEMEKLRSITRRDSKKKTAARALTNQEWTEWLEKESNRKKQLIADIAKHYGKDIATVVQSLNNIAEIDPKSTSLQAENFRKLIVSYSADPRVTIVKLLDRLEVMRSLHFFPKSKQDKKAVETSLLYVPLAHQLGLYYVKSELEDLSMKFREPDLYRLISNKLKTTVGEREKLIAEFIKPIEKVLKEQGLRYEIKSRTKSIHSIWKKMQAQKVDFEGVYDIFAIRIILDTPPEREKSDCWKVFSIVTDCYEHDTERMRNWITVPRPSGYESLHATVKIPDGKMVEVQIRSTRMDNIAERGSAAHWRYKGLKQEQGLQTWLDNVRRLLEAPKETSPDDTQKYFSEFKLNEIIVFTKDGDLRRLPQDASVLDFAFDVHTGLGQKCTGAIVNGKNVPIKEKLHTGDVVEILTSKNQSPGEDWLKYTVTSKARTKIKQRLREDAGKQAQIGKEILDRRLKNWKLTLTDEGLSLLLKQFKYKQITDFYAAIASGEIDATAVKERIQAPQETHEPVDSPEKPIQKVEEKASGTSDYLLIDEHLSNMRYKLAKCCNPIFGDEIFGFVSMKEGVKIHRFSCPNAAHLLDKYPYRVLKAKWRSDIAMNAFQTFIKITGYDEMGIVDAVTEAITKVGAILRAINIAEHSGMFDGRIQVSVSSNKQLDLLLHHLKSIKGMQKVMRVANS